MPIPPISDAYIDEIIKSAGPYVESINKTQGVKLRELIKTLRDYFEQEIPKKTSDLLNDSNFVTLTEVLEYTKVQTQTLSLLEQNSNILFQVNTSNSRHKRVYVYGTNGSDGEEGLLDVQFRFPQNPAIGDLVEFIKVDGEFFRPEFTYARNYGGSGPYYGFLYNTINAFEWNGSTWVYRSIDGQ